MIRVNILKNLESISTITSLSLFFLSTLSSTMLSVQNMKKTILQCHLASYINKHDVTISLCKERLFYLLDYIALIKKLKYGDRKKIKTKIDFSPK